MDDVFDIDEVYPTDNATFVRGIVADAPSRFEVVTLQGFVTAPTPPAKS